RHRTAQDRRAAVGADAILSTAGLGDPAGAGDECIGHGSRHHGRAGQSGEAREGRHPWIADAAAASAWTGRAMISPPQLEANRGNALKSTGPRTIHGKQASRRNALRHGLTAETLIEPLEDPESYRAFEAAIVAEYLPQGPVEKELVHRLASLFWRLRRATPIQTGPLRLRSEILPRFRSPRPQPLHTPTREGSP